ncbi:MAG: ATP-binding cassette domain-containing protein [Myxococcales bacterium]|nr:ATP-binding cassette domain-containing protein [Myxococcales bacterium]
MGSYLRLLRFVRPYRATLLVAMLCMVVLALTTGLFAYLVGPLTKYILTGGASGTERLGWLTPESLARDPKNLVSWLPYLILIVGAAKGIAYFGQFFLMGLTGQRVLVDVQNELFLHLLRRPLAYFEAESTGSILTRFTYDVAQIEQAVTYGATSILRDSLQILTLLLLAFFLDWQLALIFFVLLPAMVYPIVRFGKRLRQVSVKAQEDVGLVSRCVHETASNIKVVKAFNGESQEAMRFRRETEGYLQTMVKSLRVRGTTTPVMEFLGIFGLAASIIYATNRIGVGSLSPESFFSFFATVLMLYQPVKTLGRVNNIIAAGLAGADRIFAFIDADERIVERDNPIILHGFERELRYEGVSFTYGGEDVLHEIELSLAPGEVLAVVGASGAGKSTLVRLLPRFSDPTSGRIMLDGVDLREMSLDSLRQQIAIVTQEPLLFNDTVRNNVRYGRPDALEEEIVEALRAALAFDFVRELPKGLDTPIGERGIQLSGGERQRLCIARALLKNAPLLILDEATSSLDPESEALVRDALTNLMRGRTTIVIAHRLSTIEHADRIVVLDEGRIVESGTRSSLLEEGQRFRKIFAVS